MNRMPVVNETGIRFFMIFKIFAKNVKKNVANKNLMYYTNGV